MGRYETGPKCGFPFKMPGRHSRASLTKAIDRSSPELRRGSWLALLEEL